MMILLLCVLCEQRGATHAGDPFQLVSPSVWFLSASSARQLGPWRFQSIGGRVSHSAFAAHIMARDAVTDCMIAVTEYAYACRLLLSH